MAAIVALAYWLFALPGDQTAAEAARPEAAECEARLRAVHAELADVDRQLRAVAERVEEESRRVPNDPGEDEFLSHLLRAAKDAGLVVRDYHLIPATPVKSGCQQIAVRLSGAADYRGICRFLDSVSKATRLTTIEKLEINGADAATAYPVEVTVAVYFTGRTAADGKRGSVKNG